MTAHPKRAVADHPILPVIADRFSPYAYEPRPVEREKLRSCLEAARWAPSSYNEQPWAFLVAERTDAAAFERALGCLLEANQAWARHAGVLLLSVVQRTFTRNGKPNAACEHDVGLAAGHLVLQATALGLQAHQMIGIVPATVRSTYGIPEGFDPLTAIAIGYPAPLGTPGPLAERDVAPRSRKALDTIALRTWGTPAEVR